MTDTAWTLPGFDLDRFVRETLGEDLGDGLPGGGRDVTSESVIPDDARFSGVMDSRDAIRVAGLPVAAAFFRALDPDMEIAILVEEGTPEAQAFRMARRDPLFERMGNGQYRRLDAEGIREKSARGAGRREAARIRHAERVAHLIASHVGRLCEKGAAIPDVWFTRFPDEFGRLKGLAELVSDSRGTFVEAHRGMHLADQKAWLKAVEDYNQRHPMKAPPRDPAPVPAEDLDALDGL